MKTAALFTTRAFSSDFKSLYESMHFLNKYDKIYLFHTYKTDRIKDYIQEVAGIEVESINISNYFDNCIKGNVPTWEHLYKELLQDFTYTTTKIDDVYMFGAPQSDGGGLKRKKNGLEKNFKTNKFITFVSVSKLYFITYAAIALANAKDAVYNEMCYDPGENSTDQLTIDIRPKTVNVYHGYDIAHLNMKKHLWYQDGLRHCFNPKIKYTFEETTNYDVTFGYSYMTKERKASHEYIQDLVSHIDPIFDVKLLMKNKIENIDTSVGHDEYLDLISKSFFTFIAPAYAPDIFSCSRYMEALYFDCLPLVFDICNYKEFFESYDIPINKINGTIINRDNINEVLAMDEHVRLELVSYLKEKLQIFVL